MTGTLTPNDRRALRVAHVLNWSTDWDRPPEGLIDLLADARHWCDRHDQSFAALDRIAYRHYCDEIVCNIAPTDDLAVSDLPPRFDGYEIEPCLRFEEPDRPGHFSFEPCSPAEADVWTLYGHIPGQGVEAVGDFPTREAAADVYARITGRRFDGPSIHNNSGATA